MGLLFPLLSVGPFVARAQEEVRGSAKLAFPTVHVAK